MARFGFVYCLMNESFPGLFKIGCTDRSPVQRALELSGTGVPTEFYVVAYIECQDPQRVERDIHRRLRDYRPNAMREFFNAPLDLICAHLFFHPDMLGYMDRSAFELTGKHAYLLDSPYEHRSCHGN